MSAIFSVPEMFDFFAFAAQVGHGFNADLEMKMDPVLGDFLI